MDGDSDDQPLLRSPRQPNHQIQKKIESVQRPISGLSALPKAPKLSVKKESVPIIKTKTTQPKEIKQQKQVEEVVDPYQQQIQPKPNSFSKLISRESEPCFVERIDKIERIKRNSSKMCSSISQNSFDSNEELYKQLKPTRPESAKKT